MGLAVGWFVGLVVVWFVGLVVDLICVANGGWVWFMWFVFCLFVLWGIGKSIEERNCRRKKAGEEGRREKQIWRRGERKNYIKNLGNGGILGVVKKINK